MGDRIAQNPVLRHDHDGDQSDKTNEAIPATRSPKRCSGVSAASLSSLRPSHVPSRGSINLSVISPPTRVRTMTEQAMKYQLSITLTCSEPSSVFAASVLMPESSTSVVTISKLAVNPRRRRQSPPVIPPPGGGRRRETSGPNGGMITRAASDEMWLKGDKQHHIAGVARADVRGHFDHQRRQQAHPFGQSRAEHQRQNRPAGQIR